MVGRLFVVGIAWLAAVSLFAALLESSARPIHRLSPAQNAASTLVRTLNRASKSSGPREWVITRATSAHRTMVIDLKAEHPDSARQIAAAIVAPVQNRYDELLIYVRAVDTARDRTVRRIQWTRSAGYAERDYDDGP